MAKFIIQCPRCGNYAQGKTGFFAKKTIQCDCGHNIHVRTESLSSRVCSRCGNTVLFDQKDGHNAKCPVCGDPINKKENISNNAEFSCAQCGVRLNPDKGISEYACPVCDCVNDVEAQLLKERARNDGVVTTIKYEGNNDTFVWKHPVEDFRLGTQLIVHESQEAVFFHGGEASEIFTAGRYTINNENIPVLSKRAEEITDTKSPFHAEVYFVNKTVQMAIKWGTPNRVRFVDPVTQAPIDIGASGEMSIQVVDTMTLLKKLVGTTNTLSWGDKVSSDGVNSFAHDLKTYFKPLIHSTIKSSLAAAIKEAQLDIIEIDEHLEELSELLRQKITIGFDEYGLCIPNFYITNVLLPDDNDKNFATIKELHAQNLQMLKAEYDATMVAAKRKAILEEQETDLEKARFEAEKKRILAQAEIDIQRAEGLTEAEITKAQGLSEAEVMKAQGYTQKDVLQADVQKAFAEGIGEMGGSDGGGSGGIVSDMLGLGVGLSAMGVVGEKVGSVINSVAAADKESGETVGWSCSCGATGITGKFCSECGKAKPELWSCSCGSIGNTGKFCSECGKAKPEARTCPSCGAVGIVGKFCSECGAAMNSPETWDCSCGNKGITGKFCSECGNKKE